MVYFRRYVSSRPHGFIWFHFKKRKESEKILQEKLRNENEQDENEIKEKQISKIKNLKNKRKIIKGNN